MPITVHNEITSSLVRVTMLNLTQSEVAEELAYYLGNGWIMQGFSTTVTTDNVIRFHIILVK